jgi:hypothetical protein
MALTAEDIAALGDLIDNKVKAAVGEHVDAAVAEATTPKPQTNDEPQNQPENQPEYWVHLADGTTLVSRDSASTHMTNDSGETVAVIGRYPRVTV